MTSNELDQIAETLNQANLATRYFPYRDNLVVGVERKDLDIQDNQDIVRWERNVSASRWEIGKPVLLEDSCVVWKETSTWSFRNTIAGLSDGIH